MEKKLLNHKFAEKMYASEGGRWFLAAVVSFMLLGVLVLIFPPVFMTIDDPRIRFVLDGSASGQPCGNYLFCNVILGTVIAALYQMFPGTNVYAAYQLLCIGFASAAIGKTVYKICFRKKKQVCTAVSLHVAVYLTWCISATILMHFEVTASIVGTASAVFLLGIDACDSKLCQRVDLAVSAGCLFMTLLISKSNFYVSCCELLVAGVYQLLQARQTHCRKVMKRLAAVFLPLAAFGILLAFGCSHRAKDAQQWKDYLAYDDYRVSFWDYPHISYDENPQLYASVGWTGKFYDLVDKKMYFIDPKFQKDSLSRIVEPFSWISPMHADQMMQNAKMSVSSLLQDEPMVKVQGVLAELLCLLVIVVFLRDTKEQKHVPVYGSVLCCCVGTFLLLVFLAVRGRFPLRAWLSCMIPFGAIMLIQLLRLCKTEIVDAGKNFKYTILAAVCCFAFLHAFENGIDAKYAYRIRFNKKTNAVEDYCSLRQENIYVYDPYAIQDYRAFVRNGNKEKPVNMLIWGSSYITTPVFYDQLQYHGYEEFTTENLFDQQVYIVADKAQAETMELFLYLKEQYKGFRYEMKDEITKDCAVFQVYK